MIHTYVPKMLTYCSSLSVRYTWNSERGRDFRSSRRHLSERFTQRSNLRRCMPKRYRTSGLINVIISVEWVLNWDEYPVQIMCFYEFLNLNLFADLSPVHVCASLIVVQAGGAVHVVPQASCRCSTKDPWVLRAPLPGENVWWGEHPGRTQWAT